MIQKNVLKGLALSLLSGTLLLGSCGPKQTEEKNNTATYDKAPVDSCACEASWFPHATTPAPAEGKGSPFDTSSTTNCIFHQWSWQKFLWLTRPMPGGHVLFQDSLTQVDAQLIPVKPLSAYPGIQLVLDDSLQAGSGGTLHSNPAFAGNNSSQLVYYSIFADKTLLSSSLAFKLALQKDTNLLNNDLMFPVGALELKVSWIDTSAIPVAERSTYYITDAVTRSAKGDKVTQVALMGMHVVGRVINHPEFIWATFEHHNMGPYYDWKTTTTTQDSKITSASNLLLFEQGNTETRGGITWNNKPVIPYKVYTLYKYGVPRAPQDSFLNGTSQSEPLNYNNIEQLNACVATHLDAADVWRNYFYNGSIWLNTDGLNDLQQAQLIDSLGFNIGNGTTGSSARGSLNVFNLTMETYLQTFAADSVPTHSLAAGDLANCFGCHTGQSSVKINGKKYSNKKSPLYVSHIFKNFLNTGGAEKVASSRISDAKKQGILHFLEAQQQRKAKK